MAKGSVNLPKVALGHMSVKALDRLPDNIQQGGPFIIESTSEDETLIGHAGRVDYFVFDTRQPMGTDTIIGFEPDADFIVFEYESKQPAFKLIPIDGSTKINGVLLQDVSIYDVSDINLIVYQGDFSLV